MTLIEVASKKLRHSRHSCEDERINIKYRKRKREGERVPSPSEGS